MAASFGLVEVGPGDDCAVVRVAPSPGATGGGRLLLTVDQLVEGRHFDPATHVDLIARKAIARSISDIAAMAGTPAWALAAGVIPDGYPHADALFDSMHRWARHWGAPLVGGDIASAPKGSPLVLSVTVGGLPHSSRGPVTRSGARPGDEVWVTGRFGGSLASARHLKFEPRLREAAWLADTLGNNLHAMIDVSDGLGRDAGRIAAASSVRIEIESTRVPRHADVADAMRALADGEDYELCFTAAAGRLGSLRAPDDLAPVSMIGRVVSGAGCVTVDGAGGTQDVAELGWDHQA